MSDLEHSLLHGHEEKQPPQPFTAEYAMLKQLHNHDPMPLHMPERHLWVMLSAKAGCTFAAKWFFFQMGLLEEALAYSPWIHEYRIKKFYAQDGYRKRIKEILQPEATVIKFVRNPFDRVVSAYLAYCQELFHGNSEPRNREVIEMIASSVGRALDATQGFTFREFVQALKQHGVENCNSHFRQQVKQCELEGAIANLKIVQIETARAILPALEQELGLLASSLDKLVSSSHHTTRQDSGEFQGDQIFLNTLALPMPKSSAFFDDQLRQDVVELYRFDFEHYGYAKEPA